MRKILGAIALMIAGTAATLSLATTASATPAEPKPSFDSCPNLKGLWYANPDEQDRKPTPTVDGLKFEGDDLIHHGATGSIEGLTPGTFTLATGSDSPDQPSFFSVEVRNGDGTGYATLRWDTTENKWIMVTGGQIYKNDSASELVKMSEPDKSSSLLSFGVGYTKNPPGTKSVVVKSVKFKGVDYPLTCAPKPTASPTSASPSSSATTPSGVFYKTCSEAPHKLYKGIDAGYRLELDSDANGIACEDRPDKAASLPVTGVKLPYLLGGAAVLLVAGIGIRLWTRRKPVRFVG